MTFQPGGGRKAYVPSSSIEADRRLRKSIKFHPKLYEQSLQKRQRAIDNDDGDFYFDDYDIPNVPSTSDLMSEDPPVPANPLRNPRQILTATRTSARQAQDRTIKVALEELKQRQVNQRLQTDEVPVGTKDVPTDSTPQPRSRGRKTQAKLLDELPSTGGEDNNIDETALSMHEKIMRELLETTYVLPEDVSKNLLTNEVLNSIGYLELSKAYLKAYSKRKNGAVVLGRLESWIFDSDITVPYRVINKIANREVRARGCTDELNPNLPQMSQNLLDQFCLGLETVTFNISINHGSASYSVKVQTFCRDILEAVLYRVINNAASGLGLAGLTSSSCGSLNDISQSKCFKDVEDWVKRKFPQYPDIVACGYRLFTDGCSLGTSRGDSIQPVTIDLSPSYPRSLRGSSSLYSQLNPLFTWLPDYRGEHVTIKEQGKVEEVVSWQKLPVAVDALLSQEFKKEFYEFVLEELASAFHGKVFELPHGIGKVVFVFMGMKGDQPEMSRWTNSLGCHICTNERVLVTDDQHFRCLSTQGRIHETGWNVLSLNRIFPDGFCDPWTIFRSTDIMHTGDNAGSVHLMRPVSLIIGEGISEPVLTTSAAVQASAETKDSANEHTEPESEQAEAVLTGVPKRVAAAQKKAPWKSFVQTAENIAGIQARRFLTGKGSMSDRSFGFGGYILTMYKESVENEDAPKIKELLELSCLMYSIFLLLTDPCPGYVKNILLPRFDRARILWSDVNSFAGISAIPISVHVFFHLPKLVDYWGPALSFALYRDESHHKEFKDVVLNLTNRQRGTTKMEFLGQVLRREARRDILQYATDKSNIVRLSRVQTSTNSSAETSSSASAALESPQNYISVFVPSTKPCKIPKNIDEKTLKMLPIKKSISKLKKLGILAKDVAFPQLQFADDEEIFGRCSVHVQNKMTDQKEIYDIHVRSVGELEKRSSLHAIACAPKLSKKYVTRLANLKCNKCNDRACLSCANVELSSSLVVNLSNVPKLEDIHYLPIGFRKSGETVYCIALPLKRQKKIHDVLYIMSLIEPLVCEEIDMKRLRGTCLFHHLQTPQRELVLVERFKSSFF